jgi:hypothetical protein
MTKRPERVIKELTKLAPKFFSGLDKAITLSKFWTRNNTDDSWLVRNSQPQTDAAKRLQDALRVFAKTNDTNIIFYVESPLDTESGHYTLGPGHPANLSDWLFNANFGVAEKSGRKKLTLDLMILSDDYDMSDLNVTRLISHIASTIRHELIHYGQIKKQTSDRGKRSMLSAFRKMKQDPRQMPDDQSPKYKNTETGEWLPGGSERYYKDYLEAHIEVDAYAFEAAELLVKKFGKQGAIDILRKKINFDDPNLPTALTKYAPDLVGQEVQNALKKRIYSYIVSFDDAGLFNESSGILRELIQRVIVNQRRGH